MDIKKFNEYDGFEHYKKMLDKLEKDLKEKRFIGNSSSDLGNFIAQSIYEFMDNDDFSEEWFIAGFKHGVDVMKPEDEQKMH